MTQLELAEIMGVTDKAVSKWERDLSCPDLNSIPKLAEIFQISVDQLMQVKASAQDRASGERINSLLQLVFQCVALAMGVAVAVLTALDQIEPTQAAGMLGIGLACLSVSALSRREKEE